jgi:hypothetical protein
VRGDAHAGCGERAGETGWPQGQHRAPARLDRGSVSRQRALRTTPCRSSTGGGISVEVLYERVAGLDIGKATLAVCVRTPGPRGRRSETRKFPTTTRALGVMRDWLLECGVTIAAMESTSTYWKAPFYCLEEVMDTWLVNAAHIKAISRRKTDVQDAEWIAQLLECGLLSPSMVPPPDIRRLRMLTRYRVQLMGDRTREITRLELMLEDASIKLSSVAASLTSVSARAMLTALIEGERDPKVLADLAKGKMRIKIPQFGRGADRALQRAARPVGPHHAAPPTADRGRPRRAQCGHSDRLPAVVASAGAAADHSRSRREGRPGDPRRDRRGHDPVPDRRAPGLLGRPGSRHPRVGRQVHPGPRPTRQQVADRDAG